MISEHTVSKDSLDTINDAIIRDTFITGSIRINRENDEKTDDKNNDCCDDDVCFKWWFFHSSFQAPKESIVEDNLLFKPNRCSCCNVCSDCIELKIKNCCINTNTTNTNGIINNCFSNGCHLTCCCFTFILSAK